MNHDAKRWRISKLGTKTGLNLKQRSKPAAFSGPETDRSPSPCSDSGAYFYSFSVSTPPHALFVACHASFLSFRRDHSAFFFFRTQPSATNGTVFEEWWWRYISTPRLYPPLHPTPIFPHHSHLTSLFPNSFLHKVPFSGVISLRYQCSFNTAVAGLSDLSRTKTSAYEYICVCVYVCVCFHTSHQYFIHLPHPFIWKRKPIKTKDPHSTLTLGGRHGLVAGWMMF